MFRVIWIQSQRSEVLIGCFLRPFCSAESIAKEVVPCRTVGVDIQTLLEFRDGVVESMCLHQGNCQIEMRVGEGRCKLQGAPIMFDRLLDVPRVAQRISQIMMHNIKSGWNLTAS